MRTPGGRALTERLPPELADVLRPAVPALAEEIIAAIPNQIADYARPFEGPFGRAVRIGVERAFERFLDELAEPGTARSRTGRRTYIELGAGEFRAGRSLDALLSAYRLGARLSWRRFVEAGTAAGVAPEVLYGLGEAIFAYIDGLSAESIEGYTEAQSLAAGERSRRRRALARLLLADPPADPTELRAAADAAGWALPARVAVVVAEGPAGAAVAPDVLALEAEEELVLVVGDPDAPGRRAELERALAGRAAALGPTVTPSEAAVSAARARAALRLPGGGLVAADEHLAALALHADRRLSADLAARALAPLDDLAPGPRAKAEATLRAWLDHQGRVEAAAAALGVHPQTVRYRLGALRERFGWRLEDPDERFALAFALRVKEDPG